MLTLADIDKLSTARNTGAIYSDLYKDVFGPRPRHATFKSMAEFDEDFSHLVVMLNENQVREEQVQQANFASFLARVEDIRSTVHDCDYDRAVSILIDAEDKKKDVEWYGFESLEYELNIKYGSIAKFLESKKVLDVCA